MEGTASGNFDSGKEGNTVYLGNVSKTLKVEKDEIP